MEHTDQSPYLVCTWNIFKNNRGGLEQRQNRLYIILTHATNPDRCFVALFKKYVKHCPPPPSLAFYLTPIQIPRTSVWYTSYHSCWTQHSQTNREATMLAAFPLHLVSVYPGHTLPHGISSWPIVLLHVCVCSGVGIVKQCWCRQSGAPGVSRY